MSAASDKVSLIVLAKQTAANAKLEPALICAMVEQESNWNPWAMRYEPAFFAKYVAPLYTNNKIAASEAYARGFSWGLMQVMGQVAREVGYSEPYLSALCNPPDALAVGCKVFLEKIGKAQGDVKKALLLWNGGANSEYPAQVLARRERYL
jgi:soluble lytic murein transglycosylase-like protein